MPLREHASCHGRGSAFASWRSACFSSDMARGIWTGALSFGLVNIPVEVHTAVRDHRPHFRVHAKDGSPIGYERGVRRKGRPLHGANREGRQGQKGRVVLTRRTSPPLRSRRPAHRYSRVRRGVSHRRSFLRPRRTTSLPVKAVMWCTDCCARRSASRAASASPSSSCRGPAPRCGRSRGRGAGAVHASFCRRTGRHLDAQASEARSSPEEGARHRDVARRKRRTSGSRKNTPTITATT